MSRMPGRAGLFVLLLGVGIASAQAQEPVPATEGRSYSPADFIRYAPRTALDMLRQVPGFVVRESTQVRGIGQATGNVLLNGRRVSGKDDDVLSELGRIPAANVLRIEIVEGATLNVPGLSGVVANVVVEATGLSGRWLYRPEFRKYYTDPVLTRGEVSVSAAKGATEYTLGLVNQAGSGAAGGPTRIFNADGSFRELRDDVWVSTYDGPRLSGRLAHQHAGGSTTNLNASYQRHYWDYDEAGLRTGPGLPDRERTARIAERGYRHESGGDHEFDFAQGRFKFIGLNRARHLPIEQTVRTRALDGSAPDNGSRFSRELDERERVARGEYRWKNDASDWQVSTEAAFNTLDGRAELFVLDAGGHFQPVPIPGANVTVKEDRYELMGGYGRQLAPTLSMRLTAGAERSWLREAGQPGRTYNRPKGSASFVWSTGPELEVNLHLERRVGQLDFLDFLATVNLTDERANAGNLDLVPPQQWELQLETTRQLGEWGSTTLRLYTHRIDDIIDIIPIGTTGESPGNISRATQSGVEWKGTFQLDRVGWPGARLDTRWWVQDSSVRDPVTGQDRRISNTLIRFWQVQLRHDIPRTEWAWGTETSHEISARDVRLTEEGRRWEGPVWLSLYVERKNLGGLTLRLGAHNQAGARSLWNRTVHVARRDGPVDFFEERDRRIGPIYNLTISGTF